MFHKNPDNITYLTEKIQIHPNKVAFDKLWQVSEVCKNVWNILNEDRRENHSDYLTQKKMLPVLKAQHPEFKLPCSQVLQELVKSLDSGYKMFFTKKQQGDKTVSTPRFKSYKYFITQRYPQYGTSFEIVDSVLRVAYGSQKQHWIEIPVPDLKFNAACYKTVTISYDEIQRNWYACFTREVQLPVAAAIDEQGTMYIDPGCKTALTCIRPDYKILEYDMNPLRELTMKHYKVIDDLKSARDKKTRGSQRYRRTNALIKKLYRKINTQSKQYLHALANRILQDNPDITNFQIGDWDKRKTLADTGFTFVDKRINRQVQNNNPLQKLIGYLQYKALLLGRQVAKFHERGSTRTCSCCTKQKKSLPPAVRVFKCELCGFIMERDVNSVLNNLRKYSYALWQGLGAERALSISRWRFNPASAENPRETKRVVALRYMPSFNPSS